MIINTDYIEDPIEAAYAIMCYAHRGQQYNNTMKYYTHPLRVKEMIKAQGYSTAHQIVALLHDTVEDTKVTLNDINSRFGVVIAGAVDAISRRKDESEMEYLSRVSANPIATAVKLADMADNMCMSFHPDCPEKKKNIHTKYIRMLFSLKGASYD